MIFKKYFIALVLLSVQCILNGQVKIDLPSSQSVNKINIDNGVIVGKMQLPAFYSEEIFISDTAYLKLWFEGSSPAGELGMPELPAINRLVEIWPGSNYLVEIEESDSIVLQMENEFPISSIYPVQPGALKTYDAARQTFSGSLKSDFHTEHNLISIIPQGKMRGIRLAQVSIRPFSFNSKTNELTVFYNLSYRIEPSQDTSGNIFRPALTTPFKRAMQRVEFDAEHTNKKKVIQDQPMTMVVLSDSLFYESLNPLINWKTQKGFNVIEAYTSDPAVGKTNSEIIQYMNSLYYNPPEGYTSPSFLLIVGDVEHVPLSQSSGQITDLYYTTYDGEGDYLPEIFHGRISVKDTAELNDVVEKILLYEKYEFPDPSYLNRSILIAGYDATYAYTHGNGQINYAANYYFNEENGIDALVYRHPEASSKDMEILNEISAGAAFVNYTGHGEYYGWLNPVFQLGNVDTMKNFQKYSFMIGNGCSTNQFNITNDCFAEAVLKAENKGAIGYIGCTNDSYWDEDYYWAVGVGEITSTPLITGSSYGYYDKVFHEGIADTELWAPSMGEMIFAGNMTVQESSSTKKKYYWEIYQLMGDPTLVPWFKEPQQSTVSYPSQLPVNATKFSYTGNEYDYVAISAGGKLITAKHAKDDGNLYIELPDSLVNIDLQIVVTRDQSQPVIDSIKRNPAYGPFLEVMDYEIVEEDVEEDQMISFGESFSLDMILKNTGDSNSEVYKLRLISEDDSYSIQDSITYTVPIAAGDTVHLSNVFRLMVSAKVEDLLPVLLEFSASDGNAQNKFFIKEAIHAPQFASAGIHWDDRPAGNGNGIIEPGETLNFTWKLKNNGSYTSDSLQLKNDVNPNHFYQVDAPLEPGVPNNNAINYTFEASANQFLNSDTLLATGFKIISGSYDLTDSLTFLVNRHFEDFSEDSVPKYNFVYSENSWKSDNTVFFSGFGSMKSGSIDHGQLSSMSIEFENEQNDSISFYYKVSSERYYDFLIVKLNDAEINRWSGDVDWTKKLILLEPGIHKIEWIYSKDNNTIGGSDAAWVDMIVFPGSMNFSKNLGLTRIIHPDSDAFLTESEPVTLAITNHGSDVIPGFTASHIINNSITVEEQFGLEVQPGETIEATFSEPVDLSELGDYNIMANVEAVGDQYPGNNSFAWLVEHYMFPDLSIEYLGEDSISYNYFDLVVKVVNTGNTEIDHWKYSVYRDDAVKINDSQQIDLLPGASKDVKVNLINPSDNLHEGWYQFKIISEPDSANSNNSITRNVFWSVQSDDNYQVGQVMISPNPAGNTFSIDFSGDVHLPIQMKAFDMTGKILSNHTILKKYQRFSTERIFSQNGIFILEFIDAKGNKESAKISVVID